MGFLDKREFKVFLTFFIVYLYFIHWVGWNENRFFDLTRAIVDEGRFEIDSYANNTGDRAYYNNHYYSDKASGLSFLATPIYAGFKFVYSFFDIPKEQFTEYLIDVPSLNVTIGQPIEPGPFVLTSMFLITLVTSSLFSALTVVLIYKISKYFTKKEKNRLLGVITYGFGTLAFPYSMVFFSHALGTFFIFLAFYLLFKIKQENIKDNTCFLLAGLSTGFAITVEMSTLLILIMFLIFLGQSRKKIFVFGCLIGILPMLIYNFSIFKNPIEFPDFHSDPQIWDVYDSHIAGFITSLPSPYIIYRLTFDPYRGLFFNYPILLLFIPGVLYMYKKQKSISPMILSLFIVFLLVFSCRYEWWGGASFGPRHFLPLIPFLMLPLFTSFEKINSKIIIIFLIISISINILSLQPFESEINIFGFKPTYEKKQFSFELLNNPLQTHYLPLFLLDGPRSRIFESIVHTKLEIRDYFPMYTSEMNIFTSFGIFIFNKYFVSLIPLVLSILIWRKEIQQFIKFRWIVFAICISLLLALLSIKTTRLAYDRNWYKLEYAKNETFRWMEQNATIQLFNPNNAKLTTNMNFTIWSYYKPRELDIYLNEKEMVKLNVSNKVAYSFVFKIDSGLNELKFYSKEGCNRPFQIENGVDKRCLSFAFGDVRIEN